MAFIAVDFDSTLVKGKQALPGAKDAINLLRENGHKIIIHSCNEPRWVETILNDQDIRFDYIWDSRVDNGKPVCDLYVDDKGYRFLGDWPNEVKFILGLVEGKDNRKFDV